MTRVTGIDASPANGPTAWAFDPPVKVGPRDRVRVRWDDNAPPALIVTEHRRWYRPWRRTRVHTAKPMEGSA